jgi:hypothetical protein
MLLFIVNMTVLVLAALSLGPSFAHVLEAPPRLNTWSPELWREATVFNGQFQLFAWIGGPVDVAAILASALFVYLLAADRPALWFALAGACLLAGGLFAWVTLVAPANAVLATWQAGATPPDFDAVRWRWETGHMVVAALKALAFVAVCAATLTRHPWKTMI